MPSESTKSLGNASEEAERQGSTQGRSLEVNWEDENDPENPFNWSKLQKWFLTIVASFVTFIVGINATSVAGAAMTIAGHFGVHDNEVFTKSFWPITAWNAAAAIVPLVALPLMETVGFREAYLGSYVLFTIFVIPQAVAQNFATLIVTRVIAGSFGGILQNSLDGMIADIWYTSEERGPPIALYTFCLVGGVTIGPVIGGAIATHLYWRWIFYIQLIIYGAFFPVVIFAMKETRSHVILSKRAKQIEKSTGQPTHVPEAPELTISSLLQDAAIRPARLFFTEPVCFFFTCLTAFAYGLVFMTTQSTAIVFASTFGFSEAATGLVQSSLFIGEIVCFLTFIPKDRLYHYSKRWSDENPPKPIPEARLPLMVFGCFVGLCGGLFWYAWTCYSYFHWALPAVGLGFLGFGILTVVEGVANYVTDFYGEYANSAVACVGFGENMMAAFLPLAVPRMYTTLGYHWASSLLGFLALVLSVAPVLLIWKGKAVRARSKFTGGQDDS